MIWTSFLINLTVFIAAAATRPFVLLVNLIFLVEWWPWSVERINVILDLAVEELQVVIQGIEVSAVFKRIFLHVQYLQMLDSLHSCYIGDKVFLQL